MTVRLSSAVALCLALSSCAAARTQSFTGTALPAAQAPDFTLTDDSGAPWTLGAQRGKVVALFFGYTHCPDTCPLTLAKLTAAAREQGDRTSMILIAFVTVDPRRDTPAVLHRYVRAFSGAPIVALTGTQAQVQRVERDYHVWAQPIPGAHHGADQYDEAHSSVTYLIDREGSLRVVHNDDDAMADFSADFAALTR